VIEKERLNFDTPAVAAGEMMPFPDRSRDPQPIRRA
jgi:hypothetical protein